MTPRGYLTIPEVLKIIRARIDDDDMILQRNPKPDRTTAACESLASAIRDASVDVYTMSGGAVIRIDNDFLETPETRALVEGWEQWLSTGRVSNKSKYNGCRLFVRPTALERWLGPAAEGVPIAKTGAPGRPTSMPIVMEEFERRLKDGETAMSREAEAKALAAWFQDAYPTAPQPSWKTILNKLRPDFRPRGHGHPK
jgi:hypothetical protein